MQAKIDHRAMLFLALFVFGVAAMFQNYLAGGIYWDFIAYSLFSKSIITPAFYTALQSGHLMQAVNYQDNFYYEYYRAPLMPLLLVPLMALLGPVFIPAYLLLLMLLLVSSVIYLCRSLKLKFELLLAICITPYSLVFFSLLNGSEMLTMALLMFTAGLVARGKWQAGVLMALTGLAKYPSLIFLPLLLLLKGRERIKGIAAFALVTAPWPLFNFIAFSNPLAGYLGSFTTFNSGNPTLFPLSVFLFSLDIIILSLLPPIVIFSFLYFSNKKKTNRQTARKSTADNSKNITIWLLLLGAIGFFIVSLHSDLNNLPRHGYLLFIGMAVGLAFGIEKMLDRTEKKNKEFMTSISYNAMALITFFMLLYLYISSPANYVFNGYGSTNQTITNAVVALVQRGLANCSVVSNAWVYLRFRGINAHWPYYYNYTIQHYPMVLFAQIGTPQGFVNAKNLSQVYNYSNFVIGLPRNYICNPHPYK